MNKLPRTIVLHALETEATGGSTEWFDVSDAREMIVELNVTDAPAAFTAHMATRDNEVSGEFFNLPYDLLRVLDPAGADDAAKSEKTKRNLVSSITTPTKVCAIYKHLPAAAVHLRWSGIGATFEAKAMLK